MTELLRVAAAALIVLLLVMLWLFVVTLLARALIRTFARMEASWAWPVYMAVGVPLIFSCPTGVLVIIALIFGPLSGLEMPWTY
jgi:hypothetical protein